MYILDICKADNDWLLTRIGKLILQSKSRKQGFTCPEGIQYSCSSCTFNKVCEITDINKLGLYDKCVSCEHKYMCIFIVVEAK